MSQQNTSSTRKARPRSGMLNVAVVVAAGVIMVNTLSGNADVNEPQLAIATEANLYCGSEACGDVTN